MELGLPGEETQRLAQRAADRLITAGRKATAREDMRAAANLLDRAARLLESRDPSRLQVVADLASALAIVGDLGRAGELLDEALSGARAAGERRIEHHVVVDRELLRLRTDIEGGTARIPAIADEAIRVFEELGDEQGIAKAWRLLSEVGWSACRFGDSAGALERALEHMARTSNRRGEEEARARVTEAWSAGPMTVAEALPRSEAMLASSEAGPLTEARLLSLVAVQSACHGDIDSARRLSERSEAMLEELGALVGLATSKHKRAQVEVLAGDPKKAEEKWRESCDIFLAVGERGYLSTRAAELAEKAPARWASTTRRSITWSWPGRRAQATTSRRRRDGAARARSCLRVGAS
ncbi:MAG: hypothetical protein M3P41_07825 [Actinomycetota bacterium]|nr:hypothetical protein [Actinomycetota bacterium]